MVLESPLDSIDYLRQRGFLPHVLAPGTVLAEDVSRRNRNFTVTQADGPSFFVKQGCECDRVASLRIEAILYELFGELDQAHQLKDHLPRCCDFDRDNNILILEFDPDSENLWVYHRKRRRFSRTLAQALGTALGRIHRLTDVDTASPELLGRLPDLGPRVIPVFHRSNAGFSVDASAAALTLLTCLERVPRLGEYLENLRGEWKGSSVIHRDIKWDNCIAYPRPGSRRKTRIRIVDWEFAGLGDPCWDAASVVNDYLHFWLHALRLDGSEGPQAFIEVATASLRRESPPISGFLEAYFGALRIEGEQATARLERIFRYLPGKLVETAFKLARQRRHPSPQSAGLLQLAFNISLAPDESRQLILGL